MKEEYLHYAFKKRMWGNTFISTENETIKVLDFGEHNQNAGPDFLDTRIDYDGKIWVGAIEFHVNASDWYRHKHEKDPTYGNVTAHFVMNHDCDVKINNFLLPVVELKDKIDAKHYLGYTKLVKSKTVVPCVNFLRGIPKAVITKQKTLSLKERLWKKSLVIVEDIERSAGDRKRAFLLSLARILGGKVNQLPFEGLVERINLKWFGKLNYDPLKVEALVLGLSCLIPNDSDDPYIVQLADEFEFQKQLFDLKTEELGFKYARMRPYNFPDIRLAQLAALLNKNQFILKLLDTEFSLNELKEAFDCELNDFWKNHFRLGIRSNREINPSLSADMVDLIIINTVVPYIYAIGLLEGNDELNEKAIELLQQIDSEKNGIIDNWKNAGLEVKSAFDSQSLLELKKHSCNRKKCLFCNIGKQILKR